MGKRLVIKGANFTQNGMVESYLEFTSGTLQGYIIVAGDNWGRLSGTSTTYYGNYVHSSKEIIIEAGDALVLLDHPTEVANRVTINAYKSVNYGEGYSYVDFTSLVTCGSSVRTIGTHFGSSDPNGVLYAGTDLPVVFTNNTGQRVWVVINIRNENSNPSLTPSNTPTIPYRIYTMHPENYQQEEEEEAT